MELLGWNLNCLHTWFPDLHTLIYHNNPPILFLQETHLHPVHLEPICFSLLMAVMWSGPVEMAVLTCDFINLTSVLHYMLSLSSLPPVHILWHLPTACSPNSSGRFISKCMRSALLYQFQQQGFNLAFNCFRSDFTCHTSSKLIH